MKKSKNMGFSLVELLISLITISLIMTAFAPVFTKKVSTTAKIQGGSGIGGNQFSYNPFDPNCTPHGNSLDCKFKIPPNVSRLSAVLVSGGGGGGGAAAGTTLLNQSKEITSNYTDIPVTKAMKNVRIESLTGAGGGGGAGAYKNWSETVTNTKTIPTPCSLTKPTSIESCHGLYRKYGAGFYPEQCIPRTRYINESCIYTVDVYTTKNAYTVGVKFKTNSCDTTVTGMCFDTPSAEPDILSKICSANKKLNFSKLPDGVFKAQFRKTMPNEGEMSNYQLSIYLYAKQAFRNGYRYVECIYDGTLNGQACVPTTIEETTQVMHYTSSGGGSGSMGSRLQNVSIPDSIIASAIGGKIRLTAGTGGAAGIKGASNGSSGGNGSTGGASSIVVYNSSGSVVYTVSAAGGNGGKGATITGAGAGAGASNSCQGASCSPSNTAGNTGNININKTTNITSSGGAQSGNGYGYGGAGGSATGTTSNTGSKGNDGYAKVVYDLYYDGAAGGGGGGSSIIHADNIPVIPNKEYIIRIGGAGQGGNANSDGISGGESAVWFEDVTIIASGGNSGKKGTSASPTTGAVQGTGGAGGIITKTGSNGTVYLKKEGSAGTGGTVLSTGAIGGAGGLSGGQTKRACGGLQNLTPSCNNGSTNGQSLTYENYGNIHSDGNYGIAGSGGGGGGWSTNSSTTPQTGSGGNGQNGYVYIYWGK